MMTSDSLGWLNGNDLFFFPNKRNDFLISMLLQSNLP
jgi:hypothetical protein